MVEDAAGVWTLGASIVLRSWREDPAIMDYFRESIKDLTFKANEARGGSVEDQQWLLETASDIALQVAAEMMVAALARE